MINRELPSRELQSREWLSGMLYIPAALVTINLVTCGHIAFSFINLTKSIIGGINVTHQSYFLNNFEVSLAFNQPIWPLK